MQRTIENADNYDNMSPIEALVVGIFTVLFMLIGIFWVGSDEHPSQYSARPHIDR